MKTCLCEPLSYMLFFISFSFSFFGHAPPTHTHTHIVLFLPFEDLLSFQVSPVLIFLWNMLHCFGLMVAGHFPFICPGQDIEVVLRRKLSAFSLVKRQHKQKHSFQIAMCLFLFNKVFVYKYAGQLSAQIFFGVTFYHAVQWCHSLFCHTAEKSRGRLYPSDTCKVRKERQ